MLADLDRLFEWTRTTINYYSKHYELSKQERQEYLQKVFDYLKGELENVK